MVKSVKTAEEMSTANNIPDAEREPSGDLRLGVLDEVIGFRLRRVQNHLSRTFSERVTRKSVRPGVFSALALIAANSGLSQRTLGQEIGFDKATVVAILDALEKLGWARRRRAPEDRRRHALYITPKGERELAGLLELARSIEAPIRNALTAQELAQLFVLLDKVHAACHAEV